MACDPDCQERTECDTVGEPGHYQCGVCEIHKQPRHHCGCVVFNFEMEYCEACKEPGHDSCSLSPGCPCCDDTIIQMEEDNVRS